MRRFPDTSAKSKPLADYRPEIAAHIPRGSIDLATVFIGFHHCPVELREEFIGGIRDVLRPGGALVVRDHHAHDEHMWRMVALAHDVFNMGTNETWEYNQRERRNFYPLETLHELLTRAGFRSDGRRLLQDGDPTLNTLLLYTKGLTRQRLSHSTYANSSSAPECASSAVGSPAAVNTRP